MKKLSFIAALMSLCTLVGCSSSSKDSADPRFEWESNPRFSEFEYGLNVDAIIGVNVPGGVSVLKIDAHDIPAKLQGMAEQMIGLSENKSGLIFDVFKDATAKSKLASAGVVTVNSGSTNFKMNFSNFLKTIKGSAEFTEIVNFKFKVHIEDAAGTIEECTVNLKLTPAPLFTVTDNLKTVQLGAVSQLKVDVKAFAKDGITAFTIAFGGNKASDFILTQVKNRTGGKLVVDLINDTASADNFGFPKDLQGKTTASIDLSTLIKGWGVDVTTASTTDVVFHVEDALGKTSEYTLQLVKN